jgi:amidohydrolase
MSSVDVAGHKEFVRQSLTEQTPTLIDLSLRIHEAAEIKFEETRSAKWVADMLTEAGFTVEFGVADLPTAIVAKFGTGSLNVGICAEYDALPGIGHACGHNIIAAAAVGAARALAPLAEALDLTITVLGTPAEEGGGGKVFMLQRGAFDGLHAAMMIHPAAIERDAMATLANSRLFVNYTGKAAHAAAAPERGINAGSALSLAQAGIGMMREHLRATDRVHGIVLHGGDAMNVIPEKTKGEWCTRGATIDDEAEVFERTVNVFKGAALMTGSSVSITRNGPVYAEVRTDEELAALWRSNAKVLGRESLPLQPSDGYASTDMGNVSYAMPVIHPLIALESDGASIHEAAFADAAGGDTGNRAVIDGATAMAWTVIDMASNDGLRRRLSNTTFRIDDATGTEHYLGFDSDAVITYPEPLH